MLTRVLAGLLDLLAPPACVACGRPVDARAEPFCDACAPAVELLECDPGVTLRAVYRYGGPVANAVRRLKYEGHSEIARALSAGLIDSALSWQGRLDAVVPVPLSAAKLRARGYNQSGLLARSLARGLDLPFRPTWLRRVRTGPRQVGQARAARLTQLHGAFCASPRARGRAVLVVDDVRTTGATLSEARRALEAAGVRAVYGIVLALADDVGAALPTEL